MAVCFMHDLSFQSNSDKINVFSNFPEWLNVFKSSDVQESTDFSSHTIY